MSSTTSLYLSESTKERLDYIRANDEFFSLAKDVAKLIKKKYINIKQEE